MAITDICFQEGEGQAFVLELVPGTLNAPADIAVEESGGQFPVVETTSDANIFIMSE